MGSLDTTDGRERLSASWTGKGIRCDDFNKTLAMVLKQVPVLMYQCLLMYFSVGVAFVVVWLLAELSNNVTMIPPYFIQGLCCRFH